MSAVEKKQTRLIDLPADCLDHIFKQLDIDELEAVSRTCNYLSSKIKEFRKKRDELNRRIEDGQPFNFEQDEINDTDGDPGHNHLADSDDDFEEFDENDDEFFDDDEEELRSFGSNYVDSDDDDNLY